MLENLFKLFKLTKLIGKFIKNFPPRAEMVVPVGTIQNTHRQTLPTAANYYNDCRNQLKIYLLVVEYLSEK
jgi:hypothetical protein